MKCCSTITGQGSGKVSSDDIYIKGSNAQSTDEIWATSKQIKKVNNDYLKRNGIDAHKIKSEIIGKNNIAHYDIYIKNDTGELVIYRKGGIGEEIPTGEYIKRD